MPKIHLGVVDVPYVQRLSLTERRRYMWLMKRRPWQSLGATVSTGDVASFIENRYALMETFATMHHDDIAGVLETRMQGALENAMMGKPASDADVYGDLSPVEEMFRRALDEREFDGVIAGVPTGASLAGVNHRLRRPHARGNAVRSSFVDTGMFRQSFKAWLEK